MSKQKKEKKRKPTKPTISRETKTQSPSPKPAKNTLDYITSIVLLPLPRLERTPIASKLIKHFKFLTSLLPLVLRTEAGSACNWMILTVVTFLLICVIV
jgi:hypothetical protein